MSDADFVRLIRLNEDFILELKGSRCPAVGSRAPNRSDLAMALDLRGRTPGIRWHCS